MFQYAHGAVITGSQFNNQYVVHTVNDDSREHSVSQSISRSLVYVSLTIIWQDKILRRLNCLIAIVLF